VIIIYECLGCYEENERGGRRERSKRRRKRMRKTAEEEEAENRDNDRPEMSGVELEFAGW
jgi:hypothetical protein